MAKEKKQALDGRQTEALRALPSIEEVMESPELAAASEQYGRELVVDSARAVLERSRQAILAGKGPAPEPGKPDLPRLAGLVLAEAARVFEPSLRSVINATGVVVHTNLGRSVLAPEAIAAVVAAADSYSNLEYNLDEGRRGSRHDHITRIVTALTGAEDALVVNNNAAAVLLALTVFGGGREVVVSRGELIEIGGSFRIPDIMAASTARLVEVGTTNKTKLADYEKAIGPDTAVLLRVHTSNYKVVGFTAGVDIADLAELGHERGLVVIDDLGSGALAEMPALADEPWVHDSLAAGADVVTFSGDKLLGGPQAGIVAGRREFIEKMKAHPMARAMRVDKMTLAALQATLALYLKPEEALAKIPTLRQLNEPGDSLRERAEELADSLRGALGDEAMIGVEQSASKVGGGALPLLELESWVCSVVPASITIDDLAARLRECDPPVIGRIHKDRLLLDVRTVLPGQEDMIVKALARALQVPA